MGRSILIGDDDAAVRDALRRVFRGRAWDIAAAEEWRSTSGAGRTSCCSRSAALAAVSSVVRSATRSSRTALSVRYRASRCRSAARCRSVSACAAAMSRSATHAPVARGGSVWLSPLDRGLRVTPEVCLATMAAARRVARTDERLQVCAYVAPGTSTETPRRA